MFGSGVGNFALGKEAPLKKHIQECTAVGRVIPEGAWKCRKCGEFLYASLKHNRRTHEAACRGSAKANRTCSKCNTEFPDNPQAPNLSRAMRTHEAHCKGAATRYVRRLHTTEEAIAKAEAKGKARAKVKAKAVAKSVRAKAKAVSKAQAKGLFTGRTGWLK